MKAKCDGYRDRPYEDDEVNGDGEPEVAAVIAGQLTLGEMPNGLSVAEMLEAIETVDAWLDGAVAETYQGQPLAQDWARVGKVIEECGEYIAALIACTGQNPRKGVCGTEEEMLKEAGDIACTAIFGIQHFTKDSARTWAIVSAAIAKAHQRAIAAAGAQ